MTRATGVGRGTGGGGKQPGAGRPKGARNRRSAAVIEQAGREGLLLPLDYLLSVVRDPQAEPQARGAAATACLPYCHVRLAPVPAFRINPDHLDDGALLVQTARLERHLARQPESEPGETVTTQVEQLFEELPKLPQRRQESVLRKLIADGEARLQRLNDPNRPGAIRPRPALRPALEATPAPPLPPDQWIHRPGATILHSPHQQPPAPADEQWLYYDPVTRKLKVPQ